MSPEIGSVRLVYRKLMAIAKTIAILGSLAEMFNGRLKMGWFNGDARKAGQTAGSTGNQVDTSKMQHQDRQRAEAARAQEIQRQQQNRS